MANLQIDAKRYPTLAEVLSPNKIVDNLSSLCELAEELFKKGQLDPHQLNNLKTVNNLALSSESDTFKSGGPG